MPGPADRTRRGVILRPGEADLSRITDAHNDVARGGGTNFRVVTLDASATSTTVDAYGYSVDRGGVAVDPQDATAKAQDPYYNKGASSDGSIVISHGSDASPGEVLVQWRQ